MSVTSPLAQAVAWRRHLHANPELSFEEVETSAFVERQLRAIGGLELSRPTATSVVARLRCGDGPVLALRADMDALPIEEESGVEFASTRPGVMHACGHDMHTAWLLAVAQTLAARRDELAGEVRFLFQHAEELPPGGARELVATGALDGVDAIVGAHVFADVEVAKVAVPSGSFMAAPDTFRIVVRGRGGHAAMPHESADPLAAAAQIVSNLQHIVSRETDPIRRAVVSVTRSTRAPRITSRPRWLNSPEPCAHSSRACATRSAPRLSESPDTSPKRTAARPRSSTTRATRR